MPGRCSNPLNDHHDTRGIDARVEAKRAALGDLVGAEISTRIADDKLLLFVTGSNLGDDEARRHTSPLKELLPLPGRSINLGLRWDF